MTLPNDEYGFPDPKALTKEQLVAIIQDLQGILWGDPDDDTRPDPAVEWDGDTLPRIADALEAQGLKPEGLT